MDLNNIYSEIILIALVIIVSYTIHYLAVKIKLPEVLFLIATGVGLQYLLENAGLSFDGYIDKSLEVLGVIGLIMIILEASSEFKLQKKNQRSLILSFIIALLLLVINTVAIGFIIHYFLISDLYTAMLYALPLSVISSSIVLPGISKMVDKKRELMTYESTFSDIIGIAAFSYMIHENQLAGLTNKYVSVSVGTVITIVVSLVVGYLLVWMLQKVKLSIKLFFLMATLVLLYSVGKILGLASLMIILVFGLMMNNYKLFFRGRPGKYIKQDALDDIVDDFSVVTKESSFLVKTFFFVVFGMTLRFEAFTDYTSLIIAMIILIVIYLVRFLVLALFVKGSIGKQLWVAPRGLITVILFFSIPLLYQYSEFNTAIVFIVIIATELIMSLSLMVGKAEEEHIDTLTFTDWDELDKEIAALNKKEPV